MKSVQAILRATEHVSVRRVPRPLESEDPCTLPAEIAIMGAESPSPDPVIVTTVNIPRSKPAARTSTPPSTSQCRRLWGMALRAIAISFAIFVIAVGTLLGWACWGAWQDTKRQEQFNREEQLIWADVERQQHNHQHFNGGER